MHDEGLYGKKNRNTPRKRYQSVDLHLQPHVQNMPSYLKDTTDFLVKQDDQAPFPPDTLLVSMDRTSLFTNIPHQDGIQACEDGWVDGYFVYRRSTLKGHIASNKLYII